MYPGSRLTSPAAWMTSPSRRDGDGAGAIEDEAGGPGRRAAVSADRSGLVPSLRIHRAAPAPAASATRSATIAIVGGRERGAPVIASAHRGAGPLHVLTDVLDELVDGVEPELVAESSPE